MERLENCYYTDLQITYEWSDPEKGSDMVRITLQTTASETLDTLREAGILDDTHILKTQFMQNVIDTASYG